MINKLVVVIPRFSTLGAVYQTKWSESRALSPREQKKKRESGCSTRINQRSRNQPRKMWNNFPPIIFFDYSTFFSFCKHFLIGPKRSNVFRAWAGAARKKKVRGRGNILGKFGTTLLLFIFSIRALFRWLIPRTDRQTRNYQHFFLWVFQCWTQLLTQLWTIPVGHAYHGRKPTFSRLTRSSHCP